MYKVLKTQKCSNLGHFGVGHIFNILTDLNASFRKAEYFIECYRKVGIDRCDECVVGVERE